MAAPISDYPMSLRPGKGSPPSFPEPQPLQIQPEFQSSEQLHPGPRFASPIQRTAQGSPSWPPVSPIAYEDQIVSPNMSGQPTTDKLADYDVSNVNRQITPSASGAIGPDAAPRTRSSGFGLQYNDGSNQTPSTSHPPQNLFMQHSGNPSAQSQSQASSSNIRPASRTPPAPMSTILYNSNSPQATSSPSSRPTISTKSPFTTPITSPPRNRPNQILLVNPTSTTALSDLLLNTLRPILPHGLEVTGYNAPYPAPTAVESVVDSVLSSETVLRDLAKYTTNNGETVQNYDAMLIASYSKHPIIDALKESFDVPVIGIMEASLYVARMLGGRFGIISTSTRMKYQIDDAVALYGLSHYFVGAESLHINPLELLGSPFLSTSSLGPDSTTSLQSSSTPKPPSSSSRSKEELEKRLAVQSRSLVGKGADTIILGSEFLSSAEAIRAVKDAVRDEDGRRTINVVDAVEAGVMMLNGLIGMGIPTSKKGMFRGEREGRRGRGQTWL